MTEESAQCGREPLVCGCGCHHFRVALKSGRMPRADCIRCDISYHFTVGMTYVVPTELGEEMVGRKETTSCKDD